MGHMCVMSAVKDMIGKKGMRCSASAVDALDKRIAAMLGEGMARAKANGRMTVMAQDL